MRLLYSLLLLCCCTQLFAQTTEVTVTVLDEKLKPLAGASVALVETQAASQVAATTDGKGMATLTLTEGLSWMLHVNGVPYKQHVAEVVADGIITTTFQVVHNVALRNRLGQQVYKRQHLQLYQQQVGEKDQPAPGQSKIAIQVLGANRQPKRDKQVSLVNVKAVVRYAAMTNTQGWVYFLVPNKSNYDVDVEEVLNSTYIDLDQRDQWVIETAVVYNEPAYKEQERTDTITQQIQPGGTQFGGRAMTTIAMLRNDNRTINNEPVYLKDVQTGKVYQSKTNKEGKAFFVLPFESKYLISFRYQPNVDVINLMEVRGQATANFEITYSPLPELEYPERFLPTPREIKLFDRSLFMPKQTPVGPVQPLILQAKQFTLPTVFAANTLYKCQLRLPATEIKERLPGNIVFLLDRSGSMEADSNFYTLKTYLKEALEGFGAADRAAIVFYNDEKTIAVPFQSIAGHTAAINTAIDKIETGGNTNIQSALHYAYQLLEKEATPNRNNIVVIVSDGYDESIADELEAIGKQYAHGSRSLTLGVGQYYNRDFMQEVADKSGGKHYTVSQGKPFGGVFRTMLDDLRQPAYENIRLVLEPVTGVTNAVGPDNKPLLVTGKKLSVALGHAVAGATLSTALRFSGNIDQTQVSARLQYRQKTTAGMKSYDVPLQNDELQQAYADVVNDYFSEMINTQLQEFAALNEAKNFSQSRKVINDIVKALKTWEGENKEVVRSEHYASLKKTILQYERAMSNLKK